MDDLHSYVVTNDLHIIGIVETWLHDGISDSEISLSGFTCYRKDRSIIKSGRGGGVLLYVHNSLSSTLAQNLNDLKSESVWCNIKVDKVKHLLVGCCYRSQQVTDHELDDLNLAIRMASAQQVLIMGDFNFPHINWSNLESNDKSSEQFLDLIQDCYLTQHVLVPTRGNNILDLVLTSESSMVDTVEVREHFATSDHNVLMWKVQCKTELHESSTVRYAYHKANYNTMNEWLSRVNWSDELKGMDANGMWIRFSSIMNEAIELFVPKSGKGKSNVQWMNRKALRARKNKMKMWTKYKESKTYNNWIEYKRVSNKAVKEYRKAKRKFEKKLVNNIRNNPKSFYSYVRSKSRTKDAVGPVVDRNGQMVDDDLQMCEQFNSYFSSVFTRENLNVKLPEADKLFNAGPQEELLDVFFNQDEVLNRINKLHCNKAPGVDGLVSNVFIEAATNISLPLFMIFRSTLNSGVVPVDWKRANVCVIYKKGARNECGNYRPVSLTSQACKLFEGILKDEI
jgi:hypothetical protein